MAHSSENRIDLRVDVHVVRFRGKLASGTPQLIRVLSDERRVKILDHAAITLAKGAVSLTLTRLQLAEPSLPARSIRP